MASLTRDEALTRAAAIEVLGYDIELDVSAGADAGAESFTSRSTIRFRGRVADAVTFVDVQALTVDSVVLDGRPLDPEAVTDGRLELDLGTVPGEHTLVCTATMAYSRDGQGLHRAVDPADGEVYLYGHSFLAAAPRVFMCFDQPDLKAPYTVRVRAPEHWSVVGNGAATHTGSGWWVLAPTPPLATYLVTVCAGPWVCRRGEHDGIPIGLHARASLAGPLERWGDEILRLLRQGLDHYHRLFGIRYPFGEYHQVFVPEFNAGAMENPGCVTLRDERLFRGTPSGEALLVSARTIEHEMAHMWFGDLVTMRWWDDLWLNEAFAEYLGTATLMAATAYQDAWTSFGIVRKTWGYAAERRPSTHPVAGTPALDAAAALQNFDGISYAKGASVVRQLSAYLGDDVFVAGLSAYLHEHAYGNGTFADLVGAFERAGGEDLAPWCDAWLRTADRDRLRVELSAADGVVTDAVLLREVPVAHPADRVHVVDVVGWTDGAEMLRTLVRTIGAVTPLPELAGRPVPDVLVPNASDLTWAGVVLDDAALAALPGGLARIPEGPARVVVWSALVDAVSHGDLDPRRVLGLIETEWVAETSAPLLERLAVTAIRRFVPEFLVEHEHDQAWERLAGAATALLARSGPASSAAVIATRTVAECSGDIPLLRGWLAGAAVPAGLDDDTDLRWLVLGNLARRGALAPEELDRAEAADRTFAGRLAALRARAALPTQEAKAWAWAEVVRPASGRSNHELIALLDGLWAATDVGLVRPYAHRFFTEIPRLSASLGEDALARVVRFGFPRVVERATLEAAETTLAGDLSPATRRNIVDGASALGEALLSRERFG
ncbi:MAG: aminopeptidase N [Lapillicoccus sp.]